MEVGAEVVEATEEDEEEEKKGEEGEGEGGQQNWSCGKKFPLLPCLVQVVIAILGLAKGVPFVDLFFCFFLNKGFIRKSAVW